MIFCLILFIFLYIIMCTLWTIFCVRAESIMYGTQILKQRVGIILNFVFAPISLYMALRRIPYDFPKKH